MNSVTIALSRESKPPLELELTLIVVVGCSSEPCTETVMSAVPHRKPPRLRHLSRPAAWSSETSSQPAMNSISSFASR